MGFPSTADDYSERALNMTRLLVGTSVSRLMLTLPGESLPTLGIEQGAILLVDHAATPRPGAAVVVVIGDTWRLLRYAEGKRGPYLVEQVGDTWRVVVDEHARIFGVVLYSILSPGFEPEPDIEPGVAYRLHRLR